MFSSNYVFFCNAGPPTVWPWPETETVFIYFFMHEKKKIKEEA